MSDSAGPQGASVPIATESIPASTAEDATTSNETVAAPEASSSIITEDVKSKPSADGNGEAAKTAEDSTAEPQATEEAKANSIDDSTAGAPKANSDEPDALVKESGNADIQNKTPRRKSTGTPASTGKKLKGKQSKSNLKANTHLDAQPGDHFFIRLKGYPLWPGIVVDDDMLPKVLSEKRPVMARRTDGTWREDLQEGGKNINERVFPVMYLSTNEFSWMRNTDLVDLDFDTVGDVSPKMRKDLQEAHRLASEKHDLEFYKGILREFQENQLALAAEKENKRREKQEKYEAAAAEKKKATSKPKKKSTLSETAVEDDTTEDVEMADIEASGELDPEEPKPKSKKRKATTDGEEGASTPQRTDSVKKPKIKINNTPKANGTDTPKASAKKESKPKASKPKKANGTTNGDGSATPKEPALTEQQKREKKEKEILFLRHKLQKGLLTKDHPPKEDEMKGMSDFITKLEGYAELEVSIIRATKINKVLKALLKLDEIPKEDEYKFKSRSTLLLEKWNKILEGEVPAKETDKKEEQTNGFVKSKSAEAEAAPEVAPDAGETKSATAPEPADVSMVDGDDSEKEAGASSESKAHEPTKETTDAASAETTA